MVFLSYKGEIDIPDLIIRVKINKKIAVAYRDVFGHGFLCGSCAMGYRFGMMADCKPAAVV